jgi:hypothetical protein
MASSPRQANLAEVAVRLKPEIPSSAAGGPQLRKGAKRPAAAGAEAAIKRAAE